MEYLPFISLSFLFLLSFVLNCYLTYRLHFNEEKYNQKIESFKKEPAPTYDAQKLLAELSRGSALLKIEVLDQGDFFIRSPRG
jgi:hypothetical protein